MKYLKNFRLFESNQESIDEILDKVSEKGIDSLTDYEKSLLDNYGKPNSNTNYKSYLISKIDNFFSSRNQEIFTMMDFQADSSPVYKQEDQTIDLIERIEKDRVEVVKYGGYKYDTDLEEYYVKYDKLSVNNLEDIIDLIEHLQELDDE
mgnify:CR=1 FL=1